MQTIEHLALGFHWKVLEKYFHKMGAEAGRRTRVNFCYFLVCEGNERKSEVHWHAFHNLYDE